MINETADGLKEERILVCITTQANSERLIDKAADIARVLEAELHILHVQRGDSIFNNSDTPDMMHRLCQYGSEKGGVIHFYCDEDIAQCIGRFVSQNHVTRIVIGQPPVENLYDIIEVKKAALKVLKEIRDNVDVIVVPRKDGVENIHFSINIKG